MEKETKNEIIKILETCIDNTITRVEEQKNYRPFHEALLTKELITASAFERSFSTSFGQGPIEEISKIIAQEDCIECERQRETMVNVNKGANDEIGRIVSSLRSNDANPNWKNEVSRVAAFNKGDYIVRKVLSDLYIKRKDEEIFISIKTVKPNIDQTEIAKKDMLLLKAHNSDFKTFLCLYYNPGGDKKSDYNWTMPFKIFNMHKDECVLIGEEYWDFIGKKGTYKELLKIFEQVGASTRKSYYHYQNSSFILDK